MFFEWGGRFFTNKKLVCNKFGGDGQAFQGTPVCKCATLTNLCDVAHTHTHGGDQVVRRPRFLGKVFGLQLVIGVEGRLHPF